MANGLSFFLKLQDKMSGPALKAAAALDKLDTALKAVDLGKLDALMAKPGAKIAVSVKSQDPLAAVDKASSRTDAALAKAEAAAVRAQERIAAAKAKAEAKEQARESKKKGADAGAGAVLPQDVDLKPIKLAEAELDALKQKLRDDKLAVTNLSASLRQLESATKKDAGAIHLAKAELQSRKDALAETQAQLVRGGQAANFGSEGTNRLTTTLRELAEAAGGKGITGLAGRLLGAAEGSKGLGETLAKTALGEELHGAAVAAGEVVGAGPGASAAIAGMGVAAAGAVAGVVVLTGAVAALALGFAGLVYKGAELAIDANDAKGDTLDMLEAMLGSAEAAHDTYDAMQDMTRDLAFTMERGQALASELASAGVTNTGLLEDSMKSIAEVDSVLKGSGEKIQKIIERAAQTDKFTLKAKQLMGTGIQMSKLYDELAKRTGHGVKQIEAELEKGKIKADVGIAALTKVVDDKFGALARKQALDLPAQFDRLKANIKNLFADVNTGPFLEALGRMLKIFDDTTVSGEAMHGVITDFFNGVFEVATKVIDYLRIGLKGLVLVGLKIAVAFEPLLIQLGLLAPASEDGQDSMDGMIDAMLLIADAAGAAATAVAWLTEKFLKLIGVIPFQEMAVAGKDAMSSLTTALKDGAITAGGSFVKGLALGILGGLGNVLDAVKTVAETAVGVFKRKWEIHSPSGVGEDLGGNLSLGVAKGIDLKARTANDNFQRLVAIPGGLLARGQATPDVPVQVPQRQAASGSSGGHQVNVDVKVEAGAIVVQGATSQEVLQGIRDQLGPLLADLLEAAMLEAGLAPTGSDG